MTLLITTLVRQLTRLFFFFFSNLFTILPRLLFECLVVGSSSVFIVVVYLLCFASNLPPTGSTVQILLIDIQYSYLIPYKKLTKKHLNIKSERIINSLLCSDCRLEPATVTSQKRLTTIRYPALYPISQPNPIGLNQQYNTSCFHFS